MTLCTACESGTCSHEGRCPIAVRDDTDEHAPWMAEPNSAFWYRCECTRRPLRCVCAGQGGSVYSAMCPIHDPTVDTTNPAWQHWYADHLETQARIRERLGW